MAKRFLYKVKGYSTNLRTKFKILVAANSSEEAANLAEELAGSDGWITSIKDTDKEVIIKGEIENDQSE